MTVLQFACLIYGAGSGVALSVAVVAAWRLTQLDQPAPRRHRAGDTRADVRQQARYEQVSISKLTRSQPGVTTGRSSSDPLTRCEVDVSTTTASAGAGLTRSPRPFDPEGPGSRGTPGTDNLGVFSLPAQEPDELSVRPVTIPPPALAGHADTLVFDGALVDTGEVKRHRRGAR